MSQIYLLQLASQQSQWLSARQATTASNIANVNTPGYRAMDVKPFSQVLDSANVTMAATNPAHFSVETEGTNVQSQAESQPWDTSLSGNSVGYEQELMKLGEIGRSYGLNTSIKQAFHRLIMSSLK